MTKLSEGIGKLPTRIGDVSLYHLTPTLSMAIATDSSGGIGKKIHDVVTVPLSQVGYYTAAVPLMELMALRAEIVGIVDNLCVELEPSGREIIEGIRILMEELNLEGTLLNGSTEENIPVTMTALGVTAIGLIDYVKCGEYESRNGDTVLLIGFPKSGEVFLREELIEGRNETVRAIDILHFSENPLVHQIRPVGSKGISYELEDLVQSMNDLNFQQVDFEGQTSIVDLSISAGPATCCILTMCERDVQEFIKSLNLPVTVLGKLANY